MTDLVRLQESPLSVQNAIKNTTSQDSHSIKIGVEQKQSCIPHQDLMTENLVIKKE